MTATQLTASSLLCLVLLANFGLKPQWQAFKAAESRVAAAAAGEKTALQQLEMLKAAVGQQPAARSAASIAEESSRVVVAIHRTKRDYGITITDLSTQGVAGAQQAVAFTTASAPDRLTGLSAQSLSMKGTYSSLDDFVSFLRAQVITEVSYLESLTVKADSFELQMRILGRGA